MDEDQLPDDDRPLPDPQEFREPLEEGAQANDAEMSESPGIELPEQPSVNEMDEMGQAADAEESLDQPPPQIPEQAQEPTPAPDDRAEPPPFADLAEMGSAAAEEAEVGQPVESVPPSVVDDLETMGAAAAVEQNTSKIPTQDQVVRSTEQRRAQELFEMDVGAFEADQGGMDFVQAESSYREVNYQWQRIMTALVIDHQHRLEQLLAMLEMER